MIRIWITSDSAGILITVDGELAGDAYLHEIERCCDEATCQKRPIRLFLRDVLNIDKSGRMLLSRMISKGVELSAFGLYTSDLVQMIRHEAGAQQGAEAESWNSTGKYSLSAPFSEMPNMSNIAEQEDVRSDPSAGR